MEKRTSDALEYRRKIIERKTQSLPYRNADGLWAARLLCPWDFLGKNIGVACHFLLQGIFLTQGSYLGLLHCRQITYCLSRLGSPWSKHLLFGNKLAAGLPHFTLATVQHLLFLAVH